MRNDIWRILNISFFVFLKQLRANSTGCLKKTEFYQIELLEILLPKGKKYLWHLWHIWIWSIRQNSVFRHPVYPDIAVARIALFSISEANIVFGHHIPKEWSLSMFAEICLVFFLIHNPAIHNPESNHYW